MKTRTISIVAWTLLLPLVPLFILIIVLGTTADWLTIKTRGGKWGPTTKMFQRERDTE